MKMKFSVIPSRAVSDPRLPHSAFRTLASLCVYTSAQGVCFPNQWTLAEIRNCTQSNIAKQMKILRTLRYVVALQSVGRKFPRAFQRGNRMFVPVREDDPIPPKEVLKEDILAETRRPPSFHTERWGLRGSNG